MSVPKGKIVVQNLMEKNNQLEKNQINRQITFSLTEFHELLDCKPTEISDSWGKKYLGCNLSLGIFSWGTVSLGTICPRGNHVGDKSFERQFSLGGNSRGFCKRAIIFGLIFWEQYSESDHPGGNYPGVKFPSGEIIRGAIVPGPIIWEAVFFGGNCPGTVKRLL